MRLLLWALLAAGLSTLSAQTPDSKPSLDNLLRLGTANLRAGRLDQAKEAFRQAQEQQPCNAPAMEGSAQVLFLQKKNDEAIAAIQGQIGKCPNVASMERVMGDALLRVERVDQALAAYQRGLALVSDPDSAVAGEYHFRIAQAQHRLGNNEGWVASLDRAKKLLPQNATVWFAWASMQELNGKKMEALEGYRETLRLDGENYTAMNNLAYLIAETGGNLDEGLDLARRARAGMPDHAEVADTIGWIFVKKRYADSALLALRPAIEKEPTKQLFRDHLLAALELKRETDTITELKAALKEAPSEENSAKVRRLIALIAR